jgi:Flp pilus assembly protein TadB
MFLPTASAFGRRIGASSAGVLLLNLVSIAIAVWGLFEMKIVGAPLIGFAMIGWFGALIWACSAKSGERRLREEDDAQQLRELVAELQARRLADSDELLLTEEAKPAATGKKHRAKLAAFALGIGVLIWGISTQIQIVGTAEVVATAAPAAVQAEPARIVVPEPDPAAQGELLFQWATANAPLVPLGR